MNWSVWAAGELERLRAADRLRRSVAFDGVGVEGVVAGRRVVSFASNDYLGLASHPAVRAAAHEAIDRFGAGSMASRLITGTRTLHHDLETALASWKHAQRALVFSSGYSANVGTIAALGGPDVTLFSDELNHASIIDGCRLARAHTRIYRHGDLTHLHDLLQATAGRKVVISETVFSMDGDRAAVGELAALCARHRALLILDTAHDVLATQGPTTAAEVLYVGTLSKALGALGGFVAGPDALIDLLVNRARTFIFSTALSPADAAAAMAALQICTSAEGDALRRRLRQLIDSLRSGHPSPILPIILGSDAASLDASHRLLEHGLYVPAIRPPTVPPGTSRLRVTLSALHTDAMVAELRAALAGA